jgi:hypothetical protein
MRWAGHVDSIETALHFCETQVEVVAALDHLTLR